MRWTNEDDNELKSLISEGKRYDEISNILNRTEKSIRNRCFRMGISLVYHKIFICRNCSYEFTDLIKSNRKFCSSECSGKFNSKNRVVSFETKNKIRKKLIGHKQKPESIEKISGSNNPNWIDGRSIEKRTTKIDGKRKCKICGLFSIEESRNIICIYCRSTYYEYYRIECKFKFNVFDFKEEFDLDLVRKYGFYSPTNKRNNLEGVSRDHIYSVRDGFINKIDSKIISHPANCRLILHRDNSKKSSKSIITIDELISRISEWDLKYNSLVAQLA